MSSSETPNMINLANTGWKDSLYYFADGDTTILVSKILFKVHRSILARDGSTFENMFAANADTKSRLDIAFQQDGSSDDSPIELQGDTVDEFRDLLWSMYALPHEIAAATNGEGDVVKLSNVARMAHKYHFATTEEWSLSALVSHMTVGAAPLLTHALIHLTEAAVLCDHALLLESVSRQWRFLIGKKTDLAVVMDVAERMGLREIQGLAYYTMMLEGREKWDADPILTREQRVRLLSGYYNLTKYCDRFAQEPPEFTHRVECRSPMECERNWTHLWETITTQSEFGIGMQAFAHDKLDLLGRLRMAMSVMLPFLEDRIPMLQYHGFSSSACRLAAHHATLALCVQMNENMMDFFSDVS